MSFRDMMKSLLNKPGQPSGGESCVLVPGARELEEAIMTKDRLMVLFYASWCPFSQAFLKTFLKHSASGGPCYMRILVDEGDPVASKYCIDVFPSVLYFERGRQVERLDGVFHRGLTKGQLEDFALRCAAPPGR